MDTWEDVDPGADQDWWKEHHDYAQKNGLNE